MSIEISKQLHTRNVLKNMALSYSSVQRQMTSTGKKITFWELKTHKTDVLWHLTAPQYQSEFISVFSNHSRTDTFCLGRHYTKAKFYSRF